MRTLKKAASVLLILSMLFSAAATCAFADDTDPSGSAEAEITEPEETDTGVRTLADNVTWTRQRVSSWEALKEVLQNTRWNDSYVEIVLEADITAEETLYDFSTMQPKGIRLAGSEEDQGTILTLAENIDRGYLFSTAGDNDMLLNCTVAMENLTVDCNGNGLFYGIFESVEEFTMTDVTIRNANDPGNGIIRFDGISNPVTLNMTNVKTEGCTGRLLYTPNGCVDATVTGCDLSSTTDSSSGNQAMIQLTGGSSCTSTISGSTISWKDGENGEYFASGIKATGSCVLTVSDSTITGPSGDDGGYLLTVGDSGSAYQNRNNPNGLNLENCTLGNEDGSRPVINVLDWYGTVGLGSDIKGEPEVFFASIITGSAMKLQINDRLTDKICFDYGESLSGRELTLATAGEGYTITRDDRRCLKYAGDETGYMVILDEENNELLFAKGTEADKTELDAEIAAAEKLNEEDYTAASWAAMQETLNEARNVSDDGSATQDEVTEATEALIEAMAALTEAADKSALDAEIAEAEKLNEKDYTADSWSNMQDVLSVAKEVSADGDATQEDVDAMTKELTDAVNALVETETIEADKSALKSEIAEAETLNKGDYTEDSWADLQTALDAAKEVLNDVNADQDTVDLALADLARAIADLQPTTVTGFVRSSTDGNWYYYVNSVRQSKLNSVVSGTVNGQAGWWYVVNGQVQLDYTGVCNYCNDYGWWYVKNGKVDFSCNSVEENNYGWWYVVGGKVDFSYTGVTNYSNAYGWWYVKDGKVNFGKTSIEQNKYGWWRVVKGKVDFSCNSVEQNDYGWWYVVGGKVDFSYTGVGNYSNAYGWWYIKDGKVDFSKTSIEQNNYGWWRVVNGKVDFSCNSVEQNDYGWWYVLGGKVQFGYTGVANYANAYGWWYINNGKVDFSYTGRATNNYGTWNVVNGRVVF